jgi:hypothetical protein
LTQFLMKSPKPKVTRASCITSQLIVSNTFKVQKCQNPWLIVILCIFHNVKNLSNVLAYISIFKICYLVFMYHFWKDFLNSCCY